MKNFVYIVLTGTYDESENIAAYYNKQHAIDHVKKEVGNRPDIWSFKRDSYNDKQILHARAKMYDHYDWVVEKLEIR